MGLVYKVKLGHRFSQISTDIWFFVAFNILIIRVHPCPQNGNSYTFQLRFLSKPENRLRSKTNTMNGLLLPVIVFIAVYVLISFELLNKAVAAMLGVMLLVTVRATGGADRHRAYRY